MATPAVTPTLVICVVAGLTAGAALARPDVHPPEPAANEQASAPTPPTVEPATPTPAATPSPHATPSPYGSASPTAAATASPTAPSELAGTTIAIAGFAFPSTTEVPPASTVTVTNGDSASHTLTATDDSFDTGTISGGATGTFTAPDSAGSYAYFCAIHPSMTGTLVVS